MSKTSYIHTTLENSQNVDNRTGSILTTTKGQLDLNDILNPQPADEKRQIDISWIDKALDKKAFETKYSSWDKINMDKGLWSCSCYGSNIGVVCSSSGQVFTTKDGGLSWEKYSIIENISAVAYGYSKDKESGEIIHKFIALSSSGEGVSSSDGILWQSINIAQESFTSIIFLSETFYAFTSTGSIYISKDMGILWEKVEHDFDISFSTAISDNEKTIIALGSSGKDRCIFSKDGGSSWKSLDIAPLQWSDITFGENKFIACSINGDNQIAVLDSSFKNHSWQYIEAPLKNTWKSISYGSRVFICVSHEGNTISSFDGFRWIKVPSPTGIWNNILRTPYFFIVFSIGEDNEGLNAMRSSNGGLLGISFASLNEIISNEESSKAVSISGLNGFLEYLENEKGIKAQDVRISLIDNSIEHITSFDHILKAGNYLIKKTLENAPELADFNQSFLIVHEIENYNKPNDKSSYESYQKVYKINNNMAKNITAYTRIYNKDDDTFSLWEKKNISQDEIEHIDLSKSNISVSKKDRVSSCSTFLMTGNDNLITSVDSIDLSDNKFKVNNNILNSAVSTFLVTDEKGSIYKLQKLNIKLDKSQIENLGKLAELNSINLENKEVEGFLPKEKLVKNNWEYIDNIKSIISLDNNNEISEVAKDKLLQDVGQLKFIELDTRDDILDCNQLLDAGIYYLNKELRNAPPDSLYIKVVNSYSASLGRITYQFAYKDIYKPVSYYSRQTNDALGYGMFIPADWGTLNKIDINDLQFNGVWNISQGGTGSSDGYLFKNIINNPYSSTPMTTKEWLQKFIKDKGNQGRFTVFLNNRMITDFPPIENGLGTADVIISNGAGYVGMDLHRGSALWRYSTDLNKWDKIIDYQGKLLAIPLRTGQGYITTNTINTGSGIKAGHYITVWTDKAIAVPAGGTWLQFTTAYHKSSKLPGWCDFGYIAGGVILNPDQNMLFIGFLIKIA